MIRYTNGDQEMNENLVEEGLESLFKKAKSVKPKYKLTAKQMDENIERSIIKS